MASVRVAVWACALLTACGGKVVVEGSNGGGGAGGATITTTTGTGGAGGVVDCNPTYVQCNALPPVCDPGLVPSVVGACWGTCVPILSCATVPSCANCSGFCAAYEAFGTDYRCVAASVQCQAIACSCLAQYFCVAPFDACSASTGGAMVTCSCPTC